MCVSVSLFTVCIIFQIPERALKANPCHLFKLQIFQYRKDIAQIQTYKILIQMDSVCCVLIWALSQLAIFRPLHPSTHNPSQNCAKIIQGQVQLHNFPRQAQKTCTADAIGLKSKDRTLGLHMLWVPMAKIGQQHCMQHQSQPQSQIIIFAQISGRMGGGGPKITI